MFVLMKMITNVRQGGVFAKTETLPWQAIR